MPDYQKGLICKIVALNIDNPDEVYYGSTTQGLAERMGGHRKDYKKWKTTKTNFTTSYFLFEKYEVQNCVIVLVELCPCDSKMELLEREKYYILNKKCVNKQVPTKTKQGYYGIHKTKILEDRKEHYDNNKTKKISETLRRKK